MIKQICIVLIVISFLLYFFFLRVREGVGLCRENSKWQLCCHMHFDVWKLRACTFSLPWISNISKRWRSLQPLSWLNLMQEVVTQTKDEENKSQRYYNFIKHYLEEGINISINVKPAKLTVDFRSRVQSNLLLQDEKLRMSSRKFKIRQEVSYNKIVTHLPCCIIHNYVIYRFCYHTHTTHICCGQHVICFLLHQRWYYLHLKI